MRRIATLVVTGAAAAATAITLAAAPASADTKAPLGSLHSGVTIDATVTLHKWQIGGTKRKGVTRYTKPDVVGVGTTGAWGWLDKKNHKAYLKTHLVDTKADGLAPGLELKIPGQEAFIVSPNVGKKVIDNAGYLYATHLQIREVAGHRDAKHHWFTIVKHGTYQQLF